MRRVAPLTSHTIEELGRLGGSHPGVIPRLSPGCYHGLVTSGRCTEVVPGMVGYIQGCTQGGIVWWYTRVCTPPIVHPVVYPGMHHFP